MNPEYAAYLMIFIFVGSMLALVYAGIYPERIPFLVKYYEENDN